MRIFCLILVQLVSIYTRIKGQEGLVIVCKDNHFSSDVMQVTGFQGKIGQ